MESRSEIKEPAGDNNIGVERLAPRVLLLIMIVFIMGNLGAIVDGILHPEIEYLDEEHLIVGGLTAAMTLLFFGALGLYTLRQEKLAIKNRLVMQGAAANVKKYREIFEESRDAIFMSTPEGFFTEMNPAGVKLFGYNSREEMLHIRTSDIYVNEADRETERRLHEERGAFRDHEIHMKRKDGSPLMVAVTVEVVRDESGRPHAYRGSMRDVTVPKAMAQQLLQSQKMDSIGRLAAGVAHDFNNYLTTIQGCTELVLRALPESSPLRTELTEINRAAQAAADITGQLLLFSRHQTMELHPVQLNQMVEQLSPMIQRLVGDQVRVVNHLAPDLQAAKGDAGNLGQAIANLALNASSYMPKGGDITISSCNGTVSEDYVLTHPEARAGDFVTVSVSDTGPGISGVAMAHVFEPFFQTGDENNGIGLGLSVVYGIIFQHDGWIDVDSILGRGTTFTIFLPAVTQPGEVEADDSQDAAGLASGGERILLVEDDEAVRAITEKMLRESGYEVVGARDAAEAFARFAAEKGDFQLVFSDVVLPGDDGVTLVESLKSHKPELAVLLASGYADGAVDWDKLQGRGYRFMQKPYVMPELIKTIRELLANTS